MGEFDYRDAGVPVRPDIGEAHAGAWHAIANAGTWWTGAERVAIAAEVRHATNCDFCATRKRALSPYTVAGTHNSGAGLSAGAIDAVHRIVNDQGRITASFVQSLQPGVSIEQYVELVGVTVLVFSIDEFNRGLGVAPAALPVPVPGEPSHYRPARIDDSTGFVPMVAADGAIGEEADLWPNGRSANVLRALSLVPNAFREWIPVAAAQYLSFADMANFDQPPGRSLHRTQIELVAGRVSAVNECFY